MTQPPGYGPPPEEPAAPAPGHPVPPGIPGPIRPGYPLPPTGNPLPPGYLPPGHPGPPGYPIPPGYPPVPPGYPMAPGFPVGGPIPYGVMPPPGYALPPPPALSPAGVPLADFGTRLGAYLIDGTLISIVNLALVLPFFFLFITRSFDRLSTFGPDPDPGQFFATTFGPILALEAGIVVFNLVLSYVYMVEVQHRSGQTIGKRMMRVRVVPLDPRLQLTRGMAAKRWAVEYLPGVFVAFYTLIDGFWQLWDKPFQQTLHDKAAQTVVVKVSA